MPVEELLGRARVMSRVSPSRRPILLVTLSLWRLSTVLRLGWLLQPRLMSFILFPSRLFGLGVLRWLSLLTVIICELESLFVPVDSTSFELSNRESFRRRKR
uniref:Uncharacterized protein n=1 Tax=Strombidium inclinatum TaxID=197538 RepID=A0A7S3MX39_9SPIT